MRPDQPLASSVHDRPIAGGDQSVVAGAIVSSVHSGGTRCLFARRQSADLMALS
jgi:hypothetical protein